MSRKEVDSRIPALIRNGLQENKRSFFVVIGDRCKETIVNLHYIMSTMDLRQNKSVLWAYKDKLLDFTSHRKKRENKIKKEIKRGTREKNDEDPFELWVSLHDIRYMYYKETEKVLGNTYGMCVLQDFEAITPNILARTIETVQGGGLVVLLLKGMKSLRQLSTLTMDVHSRYRTEAHGDIIPRFNERFMLSLGSCETCLVIDDEFNVLPISGGKDVKPLSLDPEEDRKAAAKKELQEISEALEEPVKSLIQLARTKDQAKALLTFVDVITEKSLRHTVALTAARGRGKSAALGVAIAAAVSFGYSNIFITSPSPENLKTFFEFVFRGFDALGYQDHTDYSIIQSTNPSFNKAIVRVNIYRSSHRQTIQYIQPQDSHVLGQAELVAIDEAAAIPLPLVRKLIGPYLVFMSSTISGYEGTGRSLSLKLIQQMREQSRTNGLTEGTVEMDRSTGKSTDERHSAFQNSGRSLTEISLTEPIRYGKADAVEKWLNSLLCLDATLPSKAKINAQGYPDPTQCQLLKVNRDTLFSFHPVAERFLQQMVALYVSSHYKNSPDDLQLMSDAPAHELFVLTPPVTEDNRLPEPLCVVQICLEGKINRQSVMNYLGRGQRPAGDLIPWLVSQQFQDDEFASLSGARVVRIATSPNHASMGYGSQALKLLVDYYEGQFTNLSEVDEGAGEKTLRRITDADLANINPLKDDIKVRDINELPPLFAKLDECRPELLEYVGVSYGLTQPLFKFWNRAAFAPVYLRQTANDLTGEHTCVMLRPLKRSGDQEWLGAFAADFHRRFLSLLSYKFREFSSVLALTIESSTSRASAEASSEHPQLTRAELDRLLTPFDQKRLDSYANNMLDYHLILDLVPTLASLYFTGYLKDIKLSSLQQAVILALGLQRKDIDAIAGEMSIGSSQLLAMFIKIMRKITSHLASVVTQAVEAEMPAAGKVGVSRQDALGVHDDEVVDDKFVPLESRLEDELEEGADEALRELRAKQKELIDSLPLDQYEIEGDAAAWEDAGKSASRAIEKGAQPVISIKSKKPKRKAEATETDGADGEQRHGKSKKKPKRRG